MINREVRTSWKSKLEFLRKPQYSTYKNISPLPAPRCFSIVLQSLLLPSGSPATLQLASYYTLEEFQYHYHFLNHSNLLDLMMTVAIGLVMAMVMVIAMAMMIAMAMAMAMVMAIAMAIEIRIGTDLSPYAYSFRL